MNINVDEISYDPQIYDVMTLKEAKHAILSPDRWEKETLFTVDHVGEILGLALGVEVIDYGCGVGRIAKGLIDKYKCSVVGIDISESMRKMSIGYVKSTRFLAISVDELKDIVDKGYKADHAIAVWALQHCLDVEQTIGLIKKSIKKGGVFYVINDFKMLIPTKKGWVDNGIDVLNILSREFKAELRMLPTHAFNSDIIKKSYIGVFKNEL